MKHTKGNWIFKEWEQEGTDFYHIRSGQQFTNLIATVHRWKGHIDKREALANAKLIAAAPDLLNALQTMMIGLNECEIPNDGHSTLNTGYTKDILIEAKNAIKKAIE